MGDVTRQKEADMASMQQQVAAAREQLRYAETELEKARNALLAQPRDLEKGFIQRLEMEIKQHAMKFERRIQVKRLPAPSLPSSPSLYRIALDPPRRMHLAGSRQLRPPSPSASSTSSSLPIRSLSLRTST